MAIRAEEPKGILIRQASLSGGELAPTLHARTDHERFFNSLKTQKNFVTHQHGIAINRPGTRYKNDTKFSGGSVARLIPFKFSESITYVLEFGNLYIRFWKNGALLGAPYEVATPYIAADLARLKWCQVGNVLFLTHANYAPQQLTRIADTNWTISNIFVFGSAFSIINSWITFNSIGITDDSSAGVSQLTGWNNAVNYVAGRYVQGSDSSLYICLQTNTNKDPTAVANKGVWWQQALDSAHIYKNWYYAITILYNDTNGALRESTIGPYVLVPNGGLFHIINLTPYTDRPIIITWAVGALPVGVASILGYNIYKGTDPNGSELGFIGFSSFTNFTDIGFIPDYTHSPPIGTNPAAVSGNPSVCSVFEQRFILANFVNNVQQVRGSATANFFNFDRVPIFIDSDSIDFTLASELREEIRSLIPLRSMLVFTQSSIWAMRGSQGAPLTPSSVDAKPHEVYGSSWVTPIKVGNQVFYIQEKSDRLRLITYDVFRDMFNSQNISQWALHFFEGFSINEMAWASVPLRVLWLVRNDGLLIGVTFSGEEQMISWHQHPMTNGAVENVCVVSEPPEDALYLVVRRVINGVTRRFVERMNTRLITDIRYGVFLDASVQFDGHNTSGTTMTVTGGFTGGADCTITASVASFVNTDPGSVIVLDPDGTAGGPFRITIIQFTSTTIVQGTVDTPITAAFQNTATTNWAFARKNFTVLGLFGNNPPLIGQTIGVLADTNDMGAIVVDVNGNFSIDTPAVVVQAGLPYNCDLETLNAYHPGGEDIRSLQKQVKRILVEVDSTRGLFVGPDFSSLIEMDARQVSDNWGNIMPFTGIVDKEINAPIGGVGKEGRACIRQSSPLPIAVLSITREIEIYGA